MNTGAIDTNPNSTERQQVMEAQANAYLVRLEMQATVEEMREFMGAFAKRYRLAADVMNLINMNLWRA